MFQKPRQGQSKPAEIAADCYPNFTIPTYRAATARHQGPHRQQKQQPNGVSRPHNHASTSNQGSQSVPEDRSAPCRHRSRRLDQREQVETTITTAAAVASQAPRPNFGLTPLTPITPLSPCPCSLPCPAFSLLRFSWTCVSRGWFAIYGVPLVLALVLHWHCTGTALPPTLSMGTDKDQPSCSCPSVA